MTTITIFDDISGTHQGFTVEGHADMAEKGEDIVCAGISTLTITTVNSIETYAVDAQNLEEFSDSEKGLIRLMLKETNDKTQLLIDSMMLGLSALEKEYPKYIRLKKKEV